MVSQDNSLPLLLKYQIEAEAFVENKRQVKAKMFILKTRGMDLVAMFHCVSISLITNVQREQSQVTTSSWYGTERVKSDRST